MSDEIFVFDPLLYCFGNGYSARGLGGEKGRRDLLSLFFESLGRYQVAFFSQELADFQNNHQHF